MMGNDSSLRTDRYSRCQRRWPSPRVACTRGSFVTPLPHLAACSCQMVCFREPKFGLSVALPFACSMPQLPCSYEFRGSNYSGKQQFPSVLRCSRQGNGDIREHALRLEDLFLKRIYNRYPGPPILANQRMVDVGGHPFAVSGFCAMLAATRFLTATTCFFGFGPRLLTVFYSFILFRNFFYFENKPLQCSQAVRQIWWQLKSHGREVPPLRACPLPSPLELLRETFAYGYTNKDPYLLSKQTHPLSSSRLRHCTELP